MRTIEYGLMQNPALGSICIWAFVRRWCSEKDQSDGVPMALIPCILAVTFHRETVELLHGRRYDGGLLNALADDRSFAVAMQKRMEDMLPQTFESLNVGFAANLFVLQKPDFKLAPLVRSRPTFNETQLHRDMFATAERLAHWFAVYPIDQISNYLQITF